MAPEGTGTHARYWPHLAALILLISTALWARPSSAQDCPAPIDLGIANVPQQTELWCWAAVSQQIIRWRHGAAPDQCELVANANSDSPRSCCQDFERCTTTGQVAQIRSLISEYGAAATHITPSTQTPMELYGTLGEGRPVILVTHPSFFGPGHVVVLRGMSFERDGKDCEPVLHVNDPAEQRIQRIAYSDIDPIWSYSIVIN